MDNMRKRGRLELYKSLNKLVAVEGLEPPARGL
jgi:hypothetical protein